MTVTTVQKIYIT